MSSSSAIPPTIQGTLAVFAPILIAGGYFQMRYPGTALAMDDPLLVDPDDPPAGGVAHAQASGFLLAAGGVGGAALTTCAYLGLPLVALGGVAAVALAGTVVLNGRARGRTAVEYAAVACGVIAVGTTGALVALFLAR
jgi:hypothetical protein